MWCVKPICWFLTSGINLRPGLVMVIVVVVAAWNVNISSCDIVVAARQGRGGRL